MPAGPSGAPTAQKTAPMSGNGQSQGTAPSTSAPSPSTATQEPSGQAGPQVAAPTTARLPQPGTHELCATCPYNFAAPAPSHLPQPRTPQAPSGSPASSAPTIQGTAPTSSSAVDGQHLVHAPVSPTSSAMSAPTQPLRGRTGGSQQATASSSYLSQGGTSPSDPQQAGRPVTQLEQQALGQTRSGPVAPLVGGLPTSSTPNIHARRRRYTAIIVILLLLLLVFAIIAYTVFAAGLFSAGTSATVTITPTSKAVSNTFTIPVVTGNPDASQNQVGGARLLSVTTPSYTQIVDATGQGTIPGTQASGTLRVENHTGNTLTIDAGTVFPNQNPTPIDVQFDQTVTLPSGGVRFIDGVPVHVVEVGAIGNIFPCCRNSPNFQNQCDGNSTCGLAHDMFSDSTFTGGTDPQNYTIVQQSDIDGAITQLTTANDPTMQQLLQQQLQGNEQLIGTPQCSPNTSADHVAGDQVSQVTVTVTFTCTGEAYRQDGALALAAQLLNQQATSDLGVGYALVGNVPTMVTDATLSDTQQGTVTLMVIAQGV